MRELKVHFLNVGRGDCTIIEFPSGRTAMVDIDNLKILDDDTRREAVAEFQESSDYAMLKALGASETQIMERALKGYSDKLTDPLNYLRNVVKTNGLFRVIITHPDMDHMTGLYRLYHQENFPIHNFWHAGPDDFNLADAEWEGSPYHEEDWEAYKTLRNAAGSPKPLVLRQGSEGNYWTEDGVRILSPTEDLVKYAVDKQKSNIVSYVLRLEFAGRAIILGGDATADECWPYILETVDKKFLSGVSVLKASHHGRKSGYYRNAVKLMAPWLTITSVGEREHDATDSYRRYSKKTVSLRRAGDICIRITEDGTLYYPPKLEEIWKPQIVESASSLTTA